MPTRDLSSLFDDDALLYPGIKSTAHPGGKTYEVPAPDAQDGLLYLRLFELGQSVGQGMKLTEEDQRRLKLDDKDEAAFYRKILGKDTFDEMAADGVSWPMIQKIAQDAFLCWASSEELADLSLAARAAGKAPAPNRAARRAKTPRGGAPTARKQAGSKSSRASGATPARTAAKVSTRSSRSTPTAEPRAAAG